MCKNDYVLYVIEQLKEMNPDIPEDGYFTSVIDRAYRLEAIRQIFGGLERNNQDEILKYALGMLLIQNPCIAEQIPYITEVTGDCKIGSNSNLINNRRYIE